MCDPAAPVTALSRVIFQAGKELEPVDSGRAHGKGLARSNLDEFAVFAADAGLRHRPEAANGALADLRRLHERTLRARLWERCSALPLR